MVNKQDKESKQLKILVYTTTFADENPKNPNPGTSNNSGATNNQQNSGNSNSMYKVIFEFLGRKIYIQCTEEDLISDICLKYCNKIQKDIKELIFLYGGNLLNLKQKLSEVMNGQDKERKQLNVVVYTNLIDEPINPNPGKDDNTEATNNQQNSGNSNGMYKVIFEFAGSQFDIECNEEELFSEISIKFRTKINKDIKNLMFLYNGNLVNLEQKLSEVVKQMDKESKQLKILVHTTIFADENPKNPNPGTSNNSGATNNQQNSGNSNSMYKVIFEFLGRKIYIQCTEEDLISDICLKYCNKIQKDIKELIFLYGGNLLNLKQKLSEVMNGQDKERKQLNVVVYTNLIDEPINPNPGKDDNIEATNNQQNSGNSNGMYKVIFQFYGRKIHIQCTEEDLFSEICKKFCVKIQKDIKELFFIYNGNLVNLEQKLSEVVNKEDKGRKVLNVLADIIQDEENINCTTNNK